MKMFLAKFVLFLLCITVPSTVKAQCTASLSVSDNSYNVTENIGPLTLDCNAGGNLVPSSYIWQINNNTVTDATEYRFITQYQDIVGGVYRCGFICGANTVWSETLTVITPPVIALSPVDLSHTVLEGNDITISCNINGGYPTPTVSWYLQDAVVGSGETLSLSSISPSNSGNYTCVAMSSAGWTTLEVEIIVDSIALPSPSPSAVMVSSSQLDVSSSTFDTTSTITGTTSSIHSSSTVSTPLDTSTSIYQSLSPSSTVLSTTPPPVVVSSTVRDPSPTSTTTASSDGPPFGNSWTSFGLIIGFAVLAILLLLVFSLICISWCCCKPKHGHSKTAVAAADKQKLLEEGGERGKVDKALLEEEKSSSGIPKSQSYVNEGFKGEDGRGSDGEEGEEEMKVTIVTKDDEKSTGDNFVVKMETNKMETNMEQPSPTPPPPEIIVSVPEPESEPIVPPRDSPVQSKDTSTSKEQVDDPVYASVGLTVEQLQEVVLDHEVASLKGNEEESSLAKEFKSIPMNLQPKSLWPEETLSKNRYRNVIPNTNTAVVLSGDGADSYINANYIEGYQGASNAYISAQAPIYETMPDFWRMIWETKVTTIVMLCKIVEGGKNKCAKYWPSSDENDTETYGVYVVRNNYEETFQSYKIVYLSVHSKNEDMSQERDVCLFMFQGWPDFGVPKDSTGLLQLREAVIINHSGGPILVHCSAGIGRTGTFINLDLNIKQYNSEGTIDPCGWTHKLRRQRGGMIQTLEQYSFLHTALADYIAKNPKKISFI